MTRAHVTRAAALLALAAGAVLVVFALDLLRWSRGLEAQDVRFLASPSQSRFSDPETLLPFKPPRRRSRGATTSPSAGNCRATPAYARASRSISSGLSRSAPRHSSASPA